MPHRLQAIQKIPSGITEVWEFFSNPEKLKEITPPHLDFRILSIVPGKQDPSADAKHGPVEPWKPDSAIRVKLETGLLIRYNIRPVLNIRLLWETEIAVVMDGESFTDVQKKGPYRLWHHQHLFREIPGGTEMTDIVDYEIPFGFLGRIVGWLLIHRDIRRIFEFREKKISEIFGNWQ